MNAINSRHTVRKFLDKPISASIVDKLNRRIELMNKQHGLTMRLVTGSSAPVWGVQKLFLTRNTDNYLVLSGPDSPNIEERLGYCGIDIALYAQMLGLNSWWIGLTYNSKAATAVKDGEVTGGIIVIGYGKGPGKPHKSKSIEEVCAYEGEMPEWFRRGVEAALLAPTAVNRQKFMITGRGNEVGITCDIGRWSAYDLGIVKYHFEAGAGRENFSWNG